MRSVCSLCACVRWFWPFPRLRALLARYRRDHENGEAKPTRRYLTHAALLLAPLVLLLLALSAFVYAARCTEAERALASKVNAMCAERLGEEEMKGQCGTQLNGTTFCLWDDPVERRDLFVYHRAEISRIGDKRQRIWPHPWCEGRQMSAVHTNMARVSFQVDVSIFGATRQTVTLMGKAATCLQQLQDADDHPCDYWPVATKPVPSYLSAATW